MMTKFFTSNTIGWRLARTLVQGIIGVCIANLDAIIGSFVIDPVWKSFIVASVMAVLSPIMAKIGKANDEKEEEAEK